MEKMNGCPCEPMPPQDTPCFCQEDPSWSPDVLWLSLCFCASVLLGLQPGDGVGGPELLLPRSVIILSIPQGSLRSSKEIFFEFSRKNFFFFHNYSAEPDSLCYLTFAPVFQSEFLEISSSIRIVSPARAGHLLSPWPGTDAA